MSPQESKTFHVPGISCQHCVDAITKEVSGIGDIAALTIDLDAKLVTVVGGSDAEIIAAIDEAGYDVSKP